MSHNPKKESVTADYAGSPTNEQLSDEVWYRPFCVIRCPKCEHLQNDYANKRDVSWNGCRKHYRSTCEKCGFAGWVPEQLRCGIHED